MPEARSGDPAGADRKERAGVCGKGFPAVGCGGTGAAAGWPDLRARSGAGRRAVAVRLCFPG